MPTNPETYLHSAGQQQVPRSAPPSSPRRRRTGGGGPGAVPGFGSVRTAAGPCGAVLGFNPSALEVMEQSFNEREAIRWIGENWYNTFLFSVAYVILIFGVQYLMKDRRGYNLRMPLALWSLGLALFSAVGAHRTWKHMVFMLTTVGFKQSVCNQLFYVDPICKLWVYLFILSKVLELGDTVFIVLRKQKLIFLHWYHHILTLIYSWYCYKEMLSGGGWFITLNLTIHTVMYSYYTVRAAGFRLPLWIAMAITFSQILQMAVGVILCILLIFWKEDEVCLCSWPSISFSLLMYLSYLVLFCKFFSKSYLTSTQKLKGV